MTNGETFITVILISTMVLGPFVAIIIVLLRHSKTTISSTEPQLFKTSFTDYFFSIEILFAAYLAIILAYIVLRMFNQHSGIPNGDWGGYLITFIVILILAALSGYVLYLAINYWKYTKDVVIRWEPVNKIISVTTSVETYELYESDIEHVTIFTNNNYKVPFDYYRFRIKNRGELLLTGRTKGVSKIFECFKQIPQQKHKRLFPIIR